MIKKKGFTLVELLSVIAILTILVLIALPNIVGFFTSSKMNSFKNEVQSAYSASEEKWVKDHITHRGEIVYARTASNNCELSLDLSGRQTFNYYIKMNNKGKIIEYYAEDGIYQYIYTGDGLKKEDITEVVEMSKINITDRINVTCDGKVQQTEPTYTLTVNPNGGTWNGSSSSQTFNQKAGTTKTISNPTSRSIQISYNDNGQGATFDSTPQTAQAPFNKWNIGGGGTLNGTTYTFGSSNGTLTAAYSPISITLKTITKNGYTCKWAGNSPAGSQVSSGGIISTSVSITFYAVCTPGGGSQTYTLTVNPNGGTWNGSLNSQTFTQSQGTTKMISNATSKSVHVSFNANNQGATFDSSSITVTLPFRQWTLSGGGSFNGTTYTFGSSNGTLIASFNATSVTLKTITKTGYTCKWAMNSTSGTQYPSGSTTSVSANTTFYAVCTANPTYTLTVNPNGGTWNGSTSTRSFFQAAGTTKSLTPNPTKQITITYNANGQGATFSNTSQNVQATFNRWTLSGAGSLNGSTYTYGTGNGTLTASYNVSTYVLQSITKTGYTCKWAQNSPSGTQFNPGSSLQTTSNVTYYAVCTGDSFKLTINPYGGTWNGSSSSQSFIQAINTTKHIPDPVGQALTVSYNSNGQNVTVPSSITVHKQFTSWSRSGAGSFNASTKTYTFGAGNGSLIANYNIVSLTLPALSKTDYTCKWAMNSASGTQYSPGSNVSITANTVFYAVCVPTNGWVLENSSTPIIDQKWVFYRGGVKQTNRWIYTSSSGINSDQGAAKRWYYFDENGYMKVGLFDYNGKTYLLTDYDNDRNGNLNGHVLSNRFIYRNGKISFLKAYAATDSNCPDNLSISDQDQRNGPNCGEIVKNGSVTRWGKTYNFDSTGACTNCMNLGLWEHSGQDSYYYIGDPSGGAYQISNRTCKVNNFSYTFDSSGKCTNCNNTWKCKNTHDWYYLIYVDVYQTQQKEINGVTYTFNSNGLCTSPTSGSSSCLTNCPDTSSVLNCS